MKVISYFYPFSRPTSKLDITLHDLLSWLSKPISKFNAPWWWWYAAVIANGQGSCVLTILRVVSYADHFSDGVSTAAVMVLNETKKAMTYEEKRKIWTECS